jgi:hypothetical protein
MSHSSSRRLLPAFGLDRLSATCGLHAVKFSIMLDPLLACSATQFYSLYDELIKLPALVVMRLSAVNEFQVNACGLRVCK